jgi:hypothetical protein
MDMMDDCLLGPPPKSPCPTWYEGRRDSGPSPLMLPAAPMMEGRAPDMLGLAARLACAPVWLMVVEWGVCEEDQGWSPAGRRQHTELWRHLASFCLQGLVCAYLGGSWRFGCENITVLATGLAGKSRCTHTLGQSLTHSWNHSVA